jgi:Flp pilus assembly protein TadG
MSMSRVCSVLATLPLVRRFARDQKGLALIEFAFVLPLMLLLYVGSVAVTMGVTTDRKVTLVTRTLGDIVAQDNNITADESTNVFNAARAILAPYDSSLTVLKSRVSSVKILANGKACVRWSRSPNSGYARTPKSDVTTFIPADLRVPSTYLIVPETEYAYKPVVAFNNVGQALTLTDKMFMRPRQSSEVTTDGQDMAACPG